MGKYYAIREIWQKDEKTLGIVWTDGLESSYDVANLRKECPCALCIDEMTGEKKLDPKSISSTVKPVSIQSIGRYAVSFTFNDGHNTGIYSFDLLRKLQPNHGGKGYH